MDPLLVVDEAVVGEVEAAVGVEDEVVRGQQRVPSHSVYRSVTVPVAGSTVWMRPPMYFAFVSPPGNVSPSMSVSVKRPPLLHT